MDRVTQRPDGGSKRPLESAHALAVQYPVRDLARAIDFLENVLDVPVRERGTDYARLDNGSVCLWLVERQGAVSPVTLVLAASDVNAAVQELLRAEGVALSRGPTWTASDRREAELRVDDWLCLIVGRTYNEDELGILPELETELAWANDAETLLKHLLKRVPVAFRKTAREKSVARSESIAIERGKVVVETADAVRALLDVTPSFQHATLGQALRDLGGPLEELVASLPELAKVSP